MKGKCELMGSKTDVNSALFPHLSSPTLLFVFTETSSSSVLPAPLLLHLDFTCFCAPLNWLVCCLSFPSLPALSSTLANLHLPIRFVSKPQLLQQPGCQAAVTTLWELVLLLLCTPAASPPQTLILLNSFLFIKYSSPWKITVSLKV